MKVSLVATLLALTLCILPVTLDGLAIITLRQDSKPPGRKDSRQNRVWKAATFRGLKMGQSSLREVLRIFGKPKSAGPEADRDNSDPDPPLYYSYEKGGEFAGELAVIIGEKSKRVLEIRNLPKKLSKKEAIRHFGQNYMEARYEFCPDVDSTAGPIYPNPNGQLLQLEYRERGIVLAIGDDGLVSEILYWDTQPGLSSKDECKRFSRKDGTRKRK